MLGVAIISFHIKTTGSPMPDSKSDDMLLLIRCPSCGQRFKVAEDLRGRTVECGGCEHRFRINDDVIVRGKKFYPGERRDARLERFHRVPLAVAPPIMGTQTVRYNEPPDPVAYEPAPPQRILAGFLGVGLMSLMALLLMFGARRGGMLDGMLTSNRLLMAGFTGLLGTVLLVYANPRGRGKAVAVGLLFSACLLGLPFFFTTGSVPLDGDRDVTTEFIVDPAPDAGPSGSLPGESGAVTELRQRIGTDPLMEENQRLQLTGSTQRAIGLWLRDMREQNRYLIRDYILRAAAADPQSHYYPRGNGDFLMVVTGITLSIEELAKLAVPLGSVERIHQEIDVIEVKVNNENFIEGPIEKLNDRDNPAFYDLNKRELDSIDLTRAEKAVKRLAEAKPEVYRSDITSRLITLLGTPEVKFKGDVCRALAVWSQQPGEASDAALREIREMLAHGVTVPPEMVELVVREKNPGVLPVIHDLWERNPQQWESLYSEVGTPAEQALLRRFPTAEGPLRYSVVRLLGKVGGAASLPALEAAMPEANAELRVLLEKSIQSIRDRGAQ
jgi:predicted Zn finger-like uncharacterized protein